MDLLAVITSLEENLRIHQQGVTDSKDEYNDSLRLFREALAGDSDKSKLFFFLFNSLNNGILYEPLKELTEKYEEIQQLTTEFEGKKEELKDKKREKLAVIEAESEKLAKIEAERKKLEDEEEKKEIYRLPPNKAQLGLTNLGDTCYANSALQIFCRLPHIRYYLQKKLSVPKPYTHHIYAEWAELRINGKKQRALELCQNKRVNQKELLEIAKIKLLKELKELDLEMTNTKQREIAPEDFIDAFLVVIGWGKTQQDSTEFIINLRQLFPNRFSIDLDQFNAMIHSYKDLTSKENLKQAIESEMEKLVLEMKRKYSSDTSHTRILLELILEDLKEYEITQLLLLMMLYELVKLLDEASFIEIQRLLIKNCKFVKETKNDDLVLHYLKDGLTTKKVTGDTTGGEVIKHAEVIKVIPQEDPSEFKVIVQFDINKDSTFVIECNGKRIEIKSPSFFHRNQTINIKFKNALREGVLQHRDELSYEESTGHIIICTWQTEYLRGKDPYWSLSDKLIFSDFDKQHFMYYSSLSILINKTSEIFQLEFFDEFFSMEIMIERKCHKCETVYNVEKQEREITLKELRENVRPPTTFVELYKEEFEKVEELEGTECLCFNCKNLLVKEMVEKDHDLREYELLTSELSLLETQARSLGIAIDKKKMTRGFRLIKFPKILFVKTTRETYDPETGETAKTKFQQLKPNLSLTFDGDSGTLYDGDGNPDDITNPINYELHSIIYHIKDPSIMANIGHYISVIKTGDGWRIYNDEKVFDTNPYEVVHQTYKWGNSPPGIIINSGNPNDDEGYFSFSRCTPVFFAYTMV